MRKDDNRNGGIAPPASSREARIAWLRRIADSHTTEEWIIEGTEESPLDNDGPCLFDSVGMLRKYIVGKIDHDTTVGPVCRPEPITEVTPPEVVADDLTPCFAVYDVTYAVR